MEYVEITKSGRMDGKWYEPGERYVMLNGIHDVRKDLMVSAGKIENDDQFACSFERTTQPHEEGTPIRVGIMNCFGTGIGDMICGSVAIRVMLANMPGPEIELYTFPWRSFVAHEIFGSIPEVKVIQSGGYAEGNAPHLLISLEKMLLDEDFDTMPMIDYFLQRLGMLEYASEADKIPQLHVDGNLEHEAIIELAKLNHSKVLMINFHASGHRRIPFFMWEKFVKLFVDDGYYVVLPCGPDGKLDHDEMCKKLAEDFPDKVTNISDFTSISLKHLIAMVNAVDAVVTPDTGIMHIAGALRKPCVGAFFSIAPELRVSYYPTVEGWLPEHFRETKYWGRHKTEGDQKLLEDDEEFMKAWEFADLAMIRILLGRAVKNA